MPKNDTTTQFEILFIFTINLLITNINLDPVHFI